MRKLNFKIKNKSGSAFIIVIGVLGVIIFGATMFMTSTVSEGRQTSMSTRGLQCTSLAEASLERAMRILAEKVNKVDPKTASADDFGILLRMPAKEGSSTMGQSDNFGTDKTLDLTGKLKKEIEFTKDDLQPNGDNELDKLVEYMTEGAAKKYEVSVKAKISNAFRNSPGKDYADFKVPGVDIGWNTRYDVKNFLDGQGYSAFEIKLPSGMKWLKFNIPIKIGSIKLLDINVTSILDKVIPDVTIDGKSYGIADFTSMDVLCNLLLNQLIARGAKKIYPVEVKLDKIKLPESVSELWPAGTGITPVEGEYLEKYGQITLECEAKITYQDNHTAARRVSAVKDFKVADCEPPAPMYSFFVNNTQNERVSFNNYGGPFYVNNFDYTGVLGKVKDKIFGGPTGDEAEKEEFPGLIRVNYSDKTDGKNSPVICNIGMFGDTGATPIEGDDSGFLTRLFQGIEALVLLSPDSGMAVVGAKYNINASVNKKDTKTNKTVPVKLKDTYKKGESTNSPISGPIQNYSVEFDKKFTPSKEAMAKPMDYLKGLLGAKDMPNLVPDVGEMSTNVISLAITLAVKPLLSNIPVVGGALGVADCFEGWEMPAMGTSNQIYPIPTTGTGTNKTHLFGYAGLHPTMTREIEGNVMKGYRKWEMCIVGMNPTDRLPLLPFAPVFLPPPPLVIPIWKASEVLDKYAFKLENFAAHKDDGSMEKGVNEYDPAMLENMAPNLYTNEQYAKKATYYYENAQAFLDDLPNRMVEANGKTVFNLNGITYISGSLGDATNPFDNGGEPFYVVGKGMIITSGNIYLGTSVVAVDKSEEEPTTFTLMARKGALLVMQGSKQLRFEGSLYTERGIYVHNKSSLHIVGNWVTNAFNKTAMGGTVVVDYVSSRVRTSLGSLHPERGKYDPRRYHVSFSPVWSAWRAY